MNKREKKKLVAKHGYKKYRISQTWFYRELKRLLPVKDLSFAKLCIAAERVDLLTELHKCRILNDLSGKGHDTWERE